MKFLGFFALIVFAQTVQYSLACGGYDVKLIKFENRKSLQVVTAEPRIRDVYLDDRCRLFIKGCATFQNSIRSAKLDVKIKKKIVTLVERKNVDVCDLLKNEKPSRRCPLLIRKPERICDNNFGPIDLSRVRRFLPLIVGDVIAEAELTTDRKDKSRFTLYLRVVKKR